MKLLHLLYFVVIVSVTKVCYAQCVIRTLVPMTLMDTYPTPNAEESSSSADDLNALLLLARALEMDRANNANNGIDVNSLLHTLINALVYTATQSGRGHPPFGPAGPGINIDNNNWQNYSPNAPPNYPMNYPQNPSNAPGQNSNYPSNSNNGNGQNSNYPSYSNNGNGKDDNGLLDVQLLNKGKDNVAKIDLAGNKLVGVGVASDSGDSGSNSGLLGGVTDTVGGLLNGLTGDNGLL